MNALLAVELPDISVSYITIFTAVILLISIIVGAKKGFLKTIINLAVLVGSIVAALYASQYVYNILAEQSFMQSEIMSALGQPLAVFITFVGSYLVLKIVGAIINKILGKIPFLGVINKILGIIFQVIIGAVFVLVVVYLLNQFTSIEIVQALIDNAMNAKEPVGKLLVEKDFIQLILDKVAASSPEMEEIIGQLSNKLSEFVELIKAKLGQATA